MKTIITLFNLMFLMYGLAFSQTLEQKNSALFQFINENRNIDELKTDFFQNSQINTLNSVREGTYTDIGKYNSLVVSVSINNQGTLLAAGYADGQIKLWDMKTGGVIKNISAHIGSVNTLQFSSNDLSLASTGEDKIIKIWDITSGTLISVLTGHIGLIKSLAFSHDGTKLASGGSDKIINIWSLLGKYLIVSLTSHTDTVNSLDFSSDDSKLASVSADSTIKIWNTYDWKESVELRGHKAPVYSATFFPDGDRLATGGGDNCIRIWNTIIGDTIAVIKSRSNLVKLIKFALDGKKLFSGSYDNTITIWDSEKYELLKTVKCTGIFQSISPDGYRAALGNGEVINIWELDSNKQLNVLSGHTSSISSIAVSSDGKLIASGSWDKTVKIWDMSSGNLSKTFQGNSDGILSLAFSPDGERLATGGFDKTVKIWAVKSGSLLYTFKDHTSFIWNVVFSPDGTMIASSDWDNNIRIWETATGNLLNTFLFAGSSIAFSPDSKRLVTGGFGVLKVWDLARGYVLKELSSLAGDIVSMTYSSDGNYLAVGSISRTVNIWDMTTYTLKKTISGFSNSVLSIAFSPDCSKILTGDGFNVDIWDTYSGNLLQALTMDYAALSARFNNDGKIIAVTRDRYIRLYDVNTLLTGGTISGKIIYNGTPLSDVTINLTGSSNLSTQTDINGFYSFIVLSGGSYSITPIKKGYSFSPAATTVTELKYNDNVNFSALLNKLTISGKVLYNSFPLTNVSVNLSVYGILSQSKTSDQQGNYSFTVDANKTYNIKPSKTGYDFQPTDKIYYSLYENQNQDFISSKTFLVGVNEDQIPTQSVLYQNYPNPFNPSTIIKYGVAKPGLVRIKIFDVLGKEIETISEKYHAAGNYTVSWIPKSSTRGISSGIYYCRFSVGNLVEIKKMVYSR